MPRPATSPPARAAPGGGRSGGSRLPFLSSLLFGGPSSRSKGAPPAAAATRPLLPPVVVPRPLPSSSSRSPSFSSSFSPCDRDLCAAAASSNTRGFETSSSSSSSSSPSSSSPSSPLSTSDWWRDDEDLWTEPRTKEEFERALAASDGGGGGGGGDGGNSGGKREPAEVVLVTFYASWCKGCRRLHPELTALAEEAGQARGSSPLAGGRVRLVRVNYDRLRSVAASAGATVLPFVAVYAPGAKADAPPLLGWQAIASRPGATRSNLIAMLSGGGGSSSFSSSSSSSSSALPPKGKKWAFPKPSIENNNAPLPELVDAAEAEAADRAREAEKLAAQASTAGLFERLAAIANGGGSSGGGGGGGSGNGVAAPPAPSSPSTPPPPPPSARKGLLARATPRQREAFLRAYPGDYNPLAEPVAAAEVAPRLRGLVYLDATGAALYSSTQVEQVARDLRENAFGNPHTGPASPPAALSAARIEGAREMVLEWFNADPGEYACIFLPSATAALKTVGEAFAWSIGGGGNGSGGGGNGNGSNGRSTSEFRYLRENHNSVLGIRGYAEAKGARAVMMTEEEVESWLEVDESESNDDDGTSSSSSSLQRKYSLFAYPALDNFSGVLHPLDWAQKLRQKKNKKNRRWFTLLDAAAFAPAHSLDLSLAKPDFVCLSFYKLFGMPTGVGALLVRREAFRALSRVYFGGGSTAIATAAPGFNVLKCEPVASFEDGTLPFLDIAALRYGFDFLRRLGAVPAGRRTSDGQENAGSDQLARHTAALAHFAAMELSKIRHARTGAPAVLVFGKHASSHWRELQGGIVNFEIVDRDSGGKLEVESYKEFEAAASKAGIALRTGAECNPGALQAAVGLADAEIRSLAGDKEGCGDENEFVEVRRERGVDAKAAEALARGDLEAAAAVFSDGYSSSSASSASSSSSSSSSSASENDDDEESGSAFEISKRPLGSIRASFGVTSTLDDAVALVEFVRGYVGELDARKEREEREG